MKMIWRLALLAVLAIGCVSASFYKTEKAADKDYLLKQKRVFQVLYHILQPDLKSDLYKEGQAWNIEANIDSYTNAQAVKDYLHRFEHGFLPRDHVFSIFYPKFYEETLSIFKLFYYAKDFDVFYKTALYARIYFNPGMFAYAFYLAVIHRPDTQYIRLPPLYEIAPYFFYNSELLEKAHHAKTFGKLETKHSAGYDTYILPYNYSNHYLSYEYNYEQRLNYFTEDIGLNMFYFYFRNDYPFFLSSEEFGFNKEYRGEEYLYGHKQLLVRYYLERLSNDLGSIEEYDYDREFYPGYYPTMNYPNGLPFPQRPENSFFPKYKYGLIHQNEEYETRISQAIDSGFVLNKTGQYVSIYTPDGLNILGNLIEGNADSYNEQYYGSVDVFGRKILGWNLEPLTRYKTHPSALEQMTMSMRDPAFYRLYKRIFSFYYKYKYNQKFYKAEEIIFPQFKIESVAIDKLITFFDYFDSTISNGLVVSSEVEAESYLIQARQYRLNHKPFNVHITINSEKATKAAIKIFLGPKFNVHNKDTDFADYFSAFYELDNFIYDLAPGTNKVERNCHDFFFVGGDQEPSEVIYKKILKSIDSGEPFTYQERIFSFPERLLLPKGKPEGMPFQFFIYVSPLDGEPQQYKSRIFGNAPLDNKPFGFPLDRPINDFDFHGPNFFFKDVLIYHKAETDMNITY